MGKSDEIKVLGKRFMRSLRHNGEAFITALKLGPGTGQKTEIDKSPACSCESDWECLCHPLWAKESYCGIAVISQSFRWLFFHLEIACLHINENTERILFRNFIWKISGH